MTARDLVGWSAWDSNGANDAATRMEGGALLGLRILGHEGTLDAHCLLTGPVVAVRAEFGRWVVTTASGSRYRLGVSLAPRQSDEVAQAA